MLRTCFRTTSHLVGALAGLLVVASLFSAEALQAEEPVLAQIRDHKQGVALWWTGHNGWLIKAQSALIGTDLVLADPERMSNPPPVSADEIAPLLDVAIVTHGHGDHFNGPTSRILVGKSRCVFLVPASCLDEAKKFGIPAERTFIARPGESVEVRGIKIDVLRALHGHTQGMVYHEANLEDCGYLLHLDGKTVLQPGDSVLLEDHLLLGNVDVLIFSPTEHNWWIDGSVTAIRSLRPDLILPQHRDTYPVNEQNRYWTNGYSFEVKARLPKELQERYRVVKMGERVLVP